MFYKSVCVINIDTNILITNSSTRSTPTGKYKNVSIIKAFALVQHKLCSYKLKYAVLKHQLCSAPSSILRYLLGTIRYKVTCYIKG